MPKTRPLPPLEAILKLFDCNPEAGIFVWKDVKDKRIPSGKIAGSMNGKGYLVVGLHVDGKRRTFLIHRLVWYVATGVDPGAKQIDHIDGNPLNNRIENLRLASHAENMRNTKLQRNNSSGYKGVTWCKRNNKWVAQIRANNRGLHLGYFPTPELAHMAYCKAAAELHGEFARVA